LNITHVGCKVGEIHTIGTDQIRAVSITDPQTVPFSDIIKQKHNILMV